MSEKIDKRYTTWHRAIHATIHNTNKQQKAMNNVFVCTQSWEMLNSVSCAEIWVCISAFGIYECKAGSTWHYEFSSVKTDWSARTK